MASSGSFTTSHCTPSSRTWYWDFSWWVSSWNGNTATISWSCTARCTSGTSGTTWIANYGFGGSIAGHGIGNPGGDFVKDKWSTSGSFTLGGGTTFGADIWAHPYSSSSTSSGSGQWTLDNNVITPTVTVSVGFKTETTIAASMSVTHNGYQPIKDNFIDLFTEPECINKVGIITGTSGTFTGLSPNKTYYARANASNGYYRGYSGVASGATYQYPYLISASDFVIGNNVTLRFYNPLNRTVELQMWSHNNQMFINPTTISATPKNNTDYTFPASNYTSNLYASIPTKNESRYNIDVWYNGNKAIGDLGKKYRVSGNNAQAPTFTDFDYKDTDPLASQLTGKNGVNNPGILVAGLSDCIFSIPTSKKATSKYGATLDKYNFSWPNGAGTSSAYSSSAEVSNHVYDGNTTTISVTAYDKRSQHKTVSKTVKLITPSKASNTSLNTVRQNGVNTTVFLAGAFKLWVGDWAGGSSRPNTLRKVEYTINGGSNYYNITSAITNNSSSSTSNNIKTITLKSNTIQLHANGSSGGFTVGTAYTVRIYVTTGVNDSTIYENRTLVATIVITAGIFGMTRYKDNNGKYHYGFNGLPDSNYTVKVHGKLNATQLSNDGAGSWIGARDYATINNTKGDTSGSYSAVVGQKTRNGHWTIGHLNDANDNLEFVYTTDTNYKAGSNNPTARAILKPKNGTIATLLDVYPVGSIYLSTSTTNPSTYFGGTWEQVGKGHYLLGYDANNTWFNKPGQNKGSADGPGSWSTNNHTLTIDEMPSHRHSFRVVKDKATNSGGALPKGCNNQGDNNGWGPAVGVNDGNNALGYTGGGKGHGHFHVSPYYTVVVWKRIA